MHEEAFMGAVSTLLLMLIGALGYYFRKETARVDSTIGDHGDTLSEHDREIRRRPTYTELEALRAKVDNDINELDKDIKNVGDRLADLLRTELTAMRSEQQRERSELNSRLDQLILAVRSTGDRR